jgi:hypothetical protein
MRDLITACCKALGVGPAAAPCAQSDSEDCDSESGSNSDNGSPGGPVEPGAVPARPIGLEESSCQSSGTPEPRARGGGPRHGPGRHGSARGRAGGAATSPAARRRRGFGSEPRRRPACSAPGRAAAHRTNRELGTCITGPGSAGLASRDRRARALPGTPGPSTSPAIWPGTDRPCRPRRRARTAAKAAGAASRRAGLGKGSPSQPGDSRPGRPWGSHGRHF